MEQDNNQIYEMVPVNLNELKKIRKKEDIINAARELG
jgi:hypothetical protein